LYSGPDIGTIIVRVIKTDGVRGWPGAGSLQFTVTAFEDGKFSGKIMQKITARKYDFIAFTTTKRTRNIF
jgi:hypothetical protein